ncbi:2-C-methyl-D-erythritol 4-phosphate cytidylyltransferase [Chloroflexota bacterium]
MRAIEERTGAVITAAGASRRMGGVDKIFANIAGQPLLAHTVSVFQRCAAVDRIVIVLSESNLEQGRRMVEEHGFSKVLEVCRGGERRQDSVFEGLRRLEECRWIAIHDGARPCLDPGLIEQGLREARETGGAIAAMPVKETIKVVGEMGIIQDTPGRETLRAAQTPQVFRSDIIMEAYRQAKGEATDDAALVEALGYQVKTYTGSYDNIKVTTSEDLALAEVILRKRGG